MPPRSFAWFERFAEWQSGADTTGSVMMSRISENVMKTSLITATENTNGR